MPDSDAPGTGAPGRRTFADKLSHLFRMARHPDEDREWTGNEVVAAINAAGTELSASHLSELRRGRKTNPTLKVIEGLAAFFDVRPSYFFGDPQVEAEVDAELELRQAMRDAQVRDVAMRAAGLGPQQRTAMLRLLAEIVREHDDR